MVCRIISSFQKTSNAEHGSKKVIDFFSTQNIRFFVSFLEGKVEAEKSFEKKIWATKNFSRVELKHDCEGLVKLQSKQKISR